MEAQGLGECGSRAGKKLMPTRRDQAKFVEEVVLSWLLNVNRKDGGKFYLYKWKDRHM